MSAFASRCVLTRLAAAAALALTLGLKFNGSFAAPADADSPALESLAERLAGAGYTAQVEIARRQVSATGPEGCQMAVRLLDPHGTNDRDYRVRLGSIGPIRYAWRGTWRDQAPRAVPLLDYFAGRELARQGLPGSRDPVWMVARSPRCAPLDAAIMDLEVQLVLPGPVS